MGEFAPGDQNASWVAIFILVIAWTLTTIPRMYYGSLKQWDDDKVKLSRAYQAYPIARDGVLLLMAAVTIAFVGRASKGVSTALSYVFMSVWMVLVSLSYVTDSKVVLNGLKLLGFILILAHII